MSTHVLIALPCLLIGGTEMHTLSLARVLVGAGYEVTVCAYYEYDPIMVAMIEATGVKVRLLHLGRNAKARNLNRMPVLAVALARLMCQLRPHVVHVQYMAPGVLPILIARSLGIRHIVATVHVPAGPYGWRRWCPQLLGTRVCDAFICVSQTAESSFFGNSAIFDEKLYRRGRAHFAIPNCVDLAEVDRVAASAQWLALRHSLGLNGHPVISAVSRLSAEKGISTLIRSMAQVVRHLPQARLVIVGDGPERDALKAEAASHGIAAHIHWIGNLPRSEAYEHLAFADVVAVPSRFEGFGLTAAEAMAFGKPVVASAVGGLREVITHEHSGLLVGVDDATAMGAAIVRLLNDPAERARMGQNGRARVDRDYSFETFANRWSRLYKALA